MRALVTGAGRRLGQSLAVALGRTGAKVLVHYRGPDPDAARHTLELLRAQGATAHAASAELEIPGEPARLVQTACDLLGGLDVLVHSASPFRKIPLQELTPEHFEKEHRDILLPAYALAHAAISPLRESRGQMVFMTCRSAQRPFRDHLGYSVAKAGVSALVRGLSRELSPDIRVNGIAPGVVLPPDDASEEERARLARLSLLGRIGEPEDVVRALLYLLDAPFVTGCELPVDGGTP